MTTTPPPSSPPDHGALLAYGARFLNAILDSADPDALGRSYWDRARSALETGTATASFSEAVSKTAAKLEIGGALTADSTAVIGGLAGVLSEVAAFGAWAELCCRDSVYVTALARIERDQRKEAAKARKQAASAVVTPEEAP